MNIELKISHIKKIFDDLNGKTLNLDEMIKMYSVDCSNLMYYRCYISLRGKVFDEEGVISMDDYYEIKEQLYQQGSMFLGDVGYRHAYVYASAKDFKFSDDPVIIEDYIIKMMITKMMISSINS